MYLRRMKRPDPSLVAYIEAEIIPRYEHFDRAHGTDHVRTVIAQSLALAARYDVATSTPDAFSRKIRNSAAGSPKSRSG